MVTLRRRLSRVLARAAVKVDPDPALRITTRLQRRINVDIAGDASAMSKVFTRPTGRDASY